ncbi:hypothetical protein [Hymenobacter ruricola]|uniref:Uncharacterized protein n=1 Tax=Hymenobacter ruricola TaxID=2791023 RepID=A0ABS0I2C4_9BACT|nr:hypothetical protein [Hymenobacter ruricola]MBF9221060.1 hypothetical protein [Hymenobacter ruricola]
MANLNLLTTKAECDQALIGLTKERGAYAHRDSNDAYADGVATDRATTVAAQLAKATADVARYTTDVARPGLTPVELRTAKRALINATSRRDNLQLSSEATTGPTAFLAEVDDDQVDGQLAVLDKAIQDVTAHKDTLSS